MIKEEALLRRVKDWLNIDPNPYTKEHVQKLVSRLEAQGHHNDEAALRELQSLFPLSRIGFGTAGLRAKMQPGPMGMNDLVVIQAAQGLARYIQRCKPDANGTPLKAVVGYDHRKESTYGLSSKDFALYTKLVFENAGITCTLLDGFVATPILAFSVTELNASVGIMVTASHNPMQDDGYKVYWNNGCQIIPPIDEGIAISIVERENLIPWTDYGHLLQQIKIRSKCSTSTCGDCYGLSDPSETKRIENKYFQTIRSSGLISYVEIDDRSKVPKFAYSAMHGVGYPYAIRSFETFGISPFLSVPTQQEADPLFPTVPFPNPEEAGALDEALKFASQNNCDIILANDPDADRLGVAEYCRNSKKWNTFSGDQIGVLLGIWIWDTIGKTSDSPVAMCASTVSSKILATIGKVEGFRFEETLTGFKWIGNRALTLKDQGFRVLFGYEEAIGFSCGGIIPDKDGISALGVIATMATNFYIRGLTLSSRLQQIYDKYGEFVCSNGYFRCDDPAVVVSILNQMRNGGNYFKCVGSYEVESVRDLGFPGYDSTTADGKPTLPVSASSPMITFRFKNGCVAQFRASGTEPKFKYYIELRGSPGESRESIETRLNEMCGVIIEELIHPLQNGLVIPSSL